MFRSSTTTSGKSSVAFWMAASRLDASPTTLIPSRCPRTNRIALRINSASSARSTFMGTIGTTTTPLFGLGRRDLEAGDHFQRYTYTFKVCSSIGGKSDELSGIPTTKLVPNSGLSRRQLSLNCPHQAQRSFFFSNHASNSYRFRRGFQLFVLVHRVHHNGNGWRAPEDLIRGPQPVQVMHSEIHNDQLGMPLSCFLDRLAAVLCFATHFAGWTRKKQRPKRLAHRFAVFRYQNPSHAAPET